MAIIPFGIVGAIVGHMIMDYDLTILSLVALLGLSGILVNDSIILVSTIEERLAAGEARHEAIVGGARDRLRAVILTSLTTIGGLLPLMFETDLQARFMIPMAVTIVFGLLLATVLVLVLVPALVGIQDDAGRRLRRWRGAAAEVPPPRASEGGRFGKERTHLAIGRDFSVRHRAMSRASRPGHGKCGNARPDPVLAPTRSSAAVRTAGR